MNRKLAEKNTWDIIEEIDKIIYKKRKHKHENNKKNINQRISN